MTDLPTQFPSDYYLSEAQNQSELLPHERVKHATNEELLALLDTPFSKEILHNEILKRMFGHMLSNDSLSD